MISSLNNIDKRYRNSLREATNAETYCSVITLFGVSRCCVKTGLSEEYYSITQRMVIYLHHGNAKTLITMPNKIIM